MILFQIALVALANQLTLSHTHSRSSTSLFSLSRTIVHVIGSQHRNTVYLFVPHAFASFSCSHTPNSLIRSASRPPIVRQRLHTALSFRRTRRRATASRQGDDGALVWADGSNKRASQIAVREQSSSRFHRCESLLCPLLFQTVHFVYPIQHVIYVD